MATNWDATYQRLLLWSDGSAKAERLVGQILLADGFERLDPSQPLGGGDGGRDAVAEKDGLKWVAAIWFPHNRKPFSELERKFTSDLQKNLDCQAFVFATNQSLSVVKRQELALLAGQITGNRHLSVEIYHLERMVALLDAPELHQTKALFLGLGGAPPLAEVRPLSVSPGVELLIGRDAELSELVADLSTSRDLPLVWLLTGLPGCGKTALARAAITEVLGADRFSDGFEVDMRGYGTGALEPSQVFPAALLALGAEPPSSRDLAAAQYYAALRDAAELGRRLLLLFDNVADVDSVAPLLPSSGSHAVLITTRNSLTPLIPGARSLRLRELALDAAGEIISHYSEVSHSGRVASAEIYEALGKVCAGLPLALRIVAAMLRTEGGLEPVDLLDELKDEATRLSNLEYEDLAVRTAFKSSYRRLDQESAGFFRLLALHPGIDFSTQSTAALVGESNGVTRRVLRKLHRWHLLEEDSGRWQLHDLLKLFSRELLQGREPVATVKAAERRLILHYAQLAEDAIGWINSEPDVAYSAFRDRVAAIGWLSCECSNVVGTAQMAADIRDDVLSYDIGTNMSAYLDMTQRREDQLRTLDLAMAAAERLGDAEKLARVANNRGIAEDAVGNSRGAVRTLEQARIWALAAGVSEVAVQALVSKSMALRHLNEIEAAKSSLREALLLSKELADGGGQAAFVLTNIGIILRELGDAQLATSVLFEAWELHRSHGARRAEGQTLAQLGIALAVQGNPEESLDYYAEARRAARDVGDDVLLVMVTSNVGAAFEQIGSVLWAAVHYRSALDMSRRLRYEEGIRRGEHLLSHLSRQIGE